MPLSSDKDALSRQLQNLRKGPPTHGAGSERRLRSVREHHTQALIADYPGLDDRRLLLLADTLARIEAAVAWLDRIDRVVACAVGRTLPSTAS